MSQNKQTYFFFVYLGNKPKPLMTQKPDVKKVYINEIVSFECKVEHSSGWEYVWHKDGKQVMVNNNFNIHGAKLSDSGTYKCKARRNKTNYNTEESDQRILVVSGERKKVTLCWRVAMCIIKRSNGAFVRNYEFHAINVMVKIKDKEDIS